MPILAITFPAIDPVALQIGPVAIKWYGLAYMAGLLLGWLYIKRLLVERRLWPANTAPFEVARVDDLLLYMTAGVILGGRLGFVLLYEPGYYLRNLTEVPQVWRGGMSFHGALLGCGAAALVFARAKGVSVRGTMDLCAAAVPIGLFFGRLANFINSELWGRPTNVPWAMVFPDGGPQPRHPSQLYEATLEGLALVIVLRWLTHTRLALKAPGTVTGVFLIGYGLARIFCEVFRDPHPGHVLNVGPMTAGIAYSIPMVILGLWFVRSARAADGKASRP
jgi:phosphatidylglycerol:prolipoprotein diacylglycerol transferase